jgi:hypothetical protein
MDITGIGIRKVPSKNYYRYVLSKSTIHYLSEGSEMLKNLPLTMRRFEVKL